MLAFSTTINPALQSGRREGSGRKEISQRTENKDCLVVPGAPRAAWRSSVTGTGSWETYSPVWGQEFKPTHWALSRCCSSGFSVPSWLLNPFLPGPRVRASVAALRNLLQLWLQGSVFGRWPLVEGTVSQSLRKDICPSVGPWASLLNMVEAQRPLGLSQSVRAWG